MNLLRQAIERDQDNAELHNQAGIVYLATRNFGEAILCFQNALELAPECPDARANLARSLKLIGRLEQALEAYRSVLAKCSTDADVQAETGAVLCQLNRLDEALPHLTAATQLRPEDPVAHYCLAWALERAGRCMEAIESYRRATEHHAFPEAEFRLGAALARVGRLSESVVAYQSAKECGIGSPDIYCALGDSLIRLGRVQEALEIHQEGLGRWPGNLELQNNAGAVLQKAGRLSESIAAYREALRICPDSSTTHTNLLCALNYDSHTTPEERFMEHVRWAERHAACIPKRRHLRNPETAERLRVGYFGEFWSDDFFMTPILASHDRSHFEIFCYGNLSRMRNRRSPLAKVQAHWRDIAQSPDTEVVEQVITDRIDILVDYVGHFGGGRMLVFAAKPAPVQVSLPGYPNTSGLATMDYRITDAEADPPGRTERLHTEELIRLPRLFTCFRPPDCAPSVGKLPALQRGKITFGSFNNRNKISPELVRLWAAILRRVPGSKLLLHHAFEGTSQVSAWFRAPLEQLFLEEGIASQRLQFIGRLPLSAHLELYREVDIALDTFPYNGFTTVLMSLWMGVPVVTLEGDVHLSRIGKTFLSAVGLNDFVAQTMEEYVEIAVRSARDIEALAALRSGLRERTASSPLLDAAGYTRFLEDAYRQMWRR